MERTINIQIPAGNNNLEVFPDEEAFQKIFAECLENNPATISNATKCYYDQMHNLFIKYLEAIQENMFRYAYQCGYEAASKFKYKRE